MTYAFSLTTFLCTVIISVFTAISISIICARNIPPRKWCLVLSLHISWGVLAIIIGKADSPYKLALSIIVITLHCFFIGLRGQDLLLKAFISILSTFGSDLVAGMFMLSIFKSDVIARARAMADPVSFLLQIGIGVMMVLLALLYRGISAFLHKRDRQQLLGYVLRPVLLLFIVAALFARAMLNLSGPDQSERLRQVLPDFMLIIVLLVVGITYVAQDIRFYRQFKENQLLTHQHSLQALLLQDTRIFRHNIANMLYGMQGTLLSGDQAAIRAYYDQMVAECQLINNENVLALKRISYPAVCAVLLNKLHEANKQHIPIYLTVGENVRWSGLRDHDMAQVLGILLDNALEAAAESSAPYVAFEASWHDGVLTLIVRNSYRGDLPSFNPTRISSTKPGHDGLGLHSIYSLLRRYRNALFNIYTVGRYVEASLTCY